MESNEFEFELGQQVTITASGEIGGVIARAQYKEGCNQYYIHYKDAGGKAVSAWWTGSLIG